MTMVEVLDQWEAQLQAIDRAQSNFADNEVDRLWDQMNQISDADWTELEGQEEFVRYMRCARQSSWDIPSALMSVCSHGSDVPLDDTPEVPFFMHRYGEEDEKWIAEHIEKYGDHVISGRVSTGDWEVTDKHFEEVHGLNLKDPQINWSFDT